MHSFLFSSAPLCPGRRSLFSSLASVCLSVRLSVGLPPAVSAVRFLFACCLLVCLTVVAAWFRFCSLLVCVFACWRVLCLFLCCFLVVVCLSVCPFCLSVFSLSLLFLFLSLFLSLASVSSMHMNCVDLAYRSFRLKGAQLEMSEKAHHGTPAMPALPTIETLQSQRLDWILADKGHDGLSLR